MGIDEHTSYLDEFNNLDVAGYAALHPELFAYVKRAMAQPGKQFLLVGDTNHDNDSLKNFLHGAPLAALFKHAAVPHVAWETPREMIEQERIDAFRETCEMYRDGLMTLDELYEERQRIFDEGPENTPNMKRTLLGFSQTGLRATPADSHQWLEGTPGQAERLFLGDREVAHYIRGRAGNDKTAVVYGAGHFYYDDTMASRLGRDKCMHVDIYPDRATYENLRHRYPTHVDMAPDKVYILDEQSLENADMALYRSAPDKDSDKIQQFRDEVAYLFGPNAPIMARFSAIAESLRPLPGTDPQWFEYVPA